MSGYLGSKMCTYKSSSYYLSCHSSRDSVCGSINACVCVSIRDGISVNRYIALADISAIFQISDICIGWHSTDINIGYRLWSNRYKYRISAECKYQISVKISRYAIPSVYLFAYYRICSSVFQNIEVNIAPHQWCASPSPDWDMTWT